MWKTELNFKLKKTPQKLHYLIWLSKGKRILLSLTRSWLGRGERQGSERISFPNQDQVFKFLRCTPSLLCTGRSIICSVLRDGTETFGLLSFVSSPLLWRKTKTSWMDVIQGERHLEQKVLSTRESGSDLSILWETVHFMVEVGKEDWGAGEKILLKRKGGSREFGMPYINNRW